MPRPAARRIIVGSVARVIQAAHVACLSLERSGPYPKSVALILAQGGNSSMLLPP